MLHLITEIGKPGRQEREKRHFPDVHNNISTPISESRGRRYIPHGYGEDRDFKPHPQFVEPKYTECGPDWKSRLRWIPSPSEQHIDYKPEIWPDTWKSLRTYPWMLQKTNNEWSLYPEGYDSTLRSKWSGVHKSTNTSTAEVTHTMLYGKGRFVVDKRNGLPQASLGDKNYQAVEFSPDFHKIGSTLPIVNFGGGKKSKSNTFVPFQELPPIPRASYAVKDKERQRQEEMVEVEALESWRPATPLIQTVAPPGAEHETTMSSVATKLTP